MNLTNQCLYLGAGTLQRHQIKCSFSKMPEHIAADIKRRLLPAYMPELRTAYIRKANEEQADAARERLAQELAALVGGKYRLPGAERNSGRPGVYVGADNLTSFEVTYAQQISIPNLTITPEMARRVLPILAGKR